MGEVQIGYQTGQTLEFLVRDANARVWNTSGGGAFVNYSTTDYASYVISMTEQGTASSYYAGTFPTAIISGGTYAVEVKRRVGGSPAETDPRIGGGDLEWNGSRVAPLSDTATSGQIGQIAPIKPARGVMIPAFPFKLVSDADNKTAFTSGVVSGQISRDGGPFVALQSGNVSELGLGWYSVPLTSGDLNAGSVALVLTANGVSGNRAAQRDFGFLMQRVSGG